MSVSKANFLLQACDSPNGISRCEVIRIQTFELNENDLATFSVSLGKWIDVARPVEFRHFLKVGLLELKPLGVFLLSENAALECVEHFVHGVLLRAQELQKENVICKRKPRVKTSESGDRSARLTLSDALDVRMLLQPFAKVF